MKVTKILDIYCIMPYKIKGNCIYKKDTGKKVGCTKGSVKKYLAALHANVTNEQKIQIKNKLKEVLRRSLKESLLSETANSEVSDVTLKAELTKNKGINFEQFEIDKIKDTLKFNINKEDTDRGMELTFEKSIGENTFYFVIKKLINESDSSKTSFKYIIFYVEKKNAASLEEKTIVYSKLSDPIKALIEGEKTDLSKKSKIESEIVKFINNSMKVNI
jgi:hypothetical protein